MIDAFIPPTLVKHAPEVTYQPLLAVKLLSRSYSVIQLDEVGLDTASFVSLSSIQSS